MLQLKIETTGNKKPLALREVEVALSGTDIQNDIENIEIYYTEENKGQSDGIRFGIAGKARC